MDIVRFLFFFYLLLILNACQKNDVPILTKFEVIKSGGNITGLTPSENNTSVSFDSLISGETWACTNSNININQNFGEYYNYSPNSEILVPGVILQGKTVQQATPEPVPLKRGPGVVYIDLWNGGSMVRKELDEASPSFTLEAINEILGEQSGIIPASFSTSKEYIYAKEQLELELRAKASILGAFKVNLYTNWKEDEEYSRMLVALDEIYYTMIFERPSSPEDFFHKDVTPEELSKFTGSGNPLVYVSSVTVGRKFYLLIETTEDKSSLEASIGASFFGNGGNLNVKTVDQLSGLNIEAYALGGDREAAIAAVYNGPEALKTFLETGASIDNGRPISYVLRSVLTDEVVKNGIATEYDYTECYPITPVENDPIFWYIADEANVEFTGWETGGGNNKIYETEIWRDISPNLNHALKSNAPGTAKGPWYDSSPECSDAAIGILYGCLFGGCSGSVLTFNSSKLIKTDYTVTIAMEKLGCEVNNGSFRSLIYGSNPEEGKMLNISIFNNKKICFSHNKANAPSLRANLPSKPCSVFSFVFSKTEGMSIYINGEIAAKDTEAIEPLSTFIGAKIGAEYSGNPGCNPEMQNLFEIIGHANALNSAQVHSLHNEITNRHNL